MTITRAVSFFLGLFLAAGLFAWVDHERNNVAYTTRSLIGQVRKGGEPVAALFYEQKRFPDGDRDTQQAMFDELVGVMQRSPVKSATNGESGKMRLDSGGTVPWRDVIVESENGDRYTVQWVKWHAAWYIYDFRR
ncbi:MAG: hypothetical protein ACO1SX_07885 [Actinomycetota bacterium]